MAAADPAGTRSLHSPVDEPQAADPLNGMDRGPQNREPQEYSRNVVEMQGSR